MNIIGKKKWFFALSLVVIIPGIISLALFGLRAGIDFSGGSRIEIQNAKFSPRGEADKVQSSKKALEKIFTGEKIEMHSIQNFQDDAFIIRTKEIDQKAYSKLVKQIQKKFPNTKEVGFQTIGPTVSAETTLNAFKSIGMASLLIVLYIAWSFRKVPKPASSLRFGVCAIIALVHDVLVVVGVFSLFGKFLGVEVDSLFVTALLTIIGFSVHDTIVVFDRIRENLIRTGASSFAKVANDSILQTINRSLNTSITVFLVLLALVLFGGESTRWFVIALLIGIISGTYSSIFTAAPLLVLWHEWREKR